MGIWASSDWDMSVICTFPSENFCPANSLKYFPSSYLLPVVLEWPRLPELHSRGLPAESVQGLRQHETIAYVKHNRRHFDCNFPFMICGDSRGWWEWRGVGIWHAELFDSSCQCRRLLCWRGSASRPSWHQFDQTPQGGAPEHDDALVPCAGENCFWWNVFKDRSTAEPRWPQIMSLFQRDNSWDIIGITDISSCSRSNRIWQRQSYISTELLRQMRHQPLHLLFTHLGNLLPRSHAEACIFW